MYRSKRFHLIRIILLLSIALGLSACNSGKVVEPTPQAKPLSQSELEAQYGLHVNLIAVTAVGGLVDLRLKFVDAEKAKSLLEDPKNYPALWIEDSKATLNAPEETKAEEIKFEDDGNLFILYSNPRDTVKPGTPVTIVMGAVRVEPISAK